MRASESVVDGHVTGRYSAPTALGPAPSGTGTGVKTLGPNADATMQDILNQQQQTQLVMDPASALSGSHARAISLFVEVPLLAYVALHPGIGGLVRLAAAARGAYRVVQVVGAPQDYELVLDMPEPG